MSPHAQRSPPFLGAHVSVAGGLVEGVRRGTGLACDSLQIFVKSPSQWQSKPLLPEDAVAFRAAHAASASTHDTSGASRNMPLLAPAGITGSLRMNFSKSAND